jgi:transposase-like protein
MAVVDQVWCPHCGRSRDRLGGVTILPGGLLRYRCGNCGAGWTETHGHRPAPPLALHPEPRLPFHAERSAA